MDDTQKAKIKASLESISGKTISDTQNDRITHYIERITADPPPEQILTCLKCAKPIRAYGTQGEAFITEHLKTVDTYYHIRCPEARL